MYSYTNKSIKGIALIEILISILLSLLLINTIFEIFIGAHKSYQMQNSLLQIKDNAQKTTDLLQEDIQLAGYIGCPRFNKHFPLFTNGMKFEPLYGDGASITVQHAALSHATVLAKMKDLTTIEANNTIHFSSKDILLISDCFHAEIFKPKMIVFQKNFQKIISSNPLHYHYDLFAEISRLIVNHYFILQDKKNFYLMKKDIHNQKHKLVAGIKQLTIRYDLLQDHEIIEAPMISLKDWEKVKGISIALTLSGGSLTKYWYSYVKI